MYNYILAHDLGTSGDKASLFSVEGALIGSRVVAYDVRYFNGCWAEQDPEDWWRAVCSASRELIRSAQIDPAEIGAVSFSGQMMGCLCVDRGGKPLRNAIIWADLRAQKQSNELVERIDPQRFYRIAGHRNTPSYGVQKLMWVKENEPEIYEQTYKVLNAKDFIVLRLTGNFYTDCSDANSMACFDLSRLNWSEELVELAGIDGDKLPEVRPSTFVAGTVTEAAARETGLAPGTAVVMGAGDGVTANVGTGSVRPGKTYCCLGTSAWVTTTSEQPVFDEQRRTVTWAHAVPGLYAPNGTMQSAGASYSWLKNTICRQESEQAGRAGVSPYELINEEVEKSPPGANGVLFLPYLMGERAPRWDPDAKGAFLGLRAETTRSDLLRSVLEGVTMNLAVVLRLLRNHVAIDEIMAVGGGAQGAVWCQILADVFRTRITVPAVIEGAGSVGAAVIAGVGTGVYRDFDAVDRFLEIRKTYEPRPETEAVYDRAGRLFDDGYSALETLFKEM